MQKKIEDIFCLLPLIVFGITQMSHGPDVALVSTRKKTTCTTLYKKKAIYKECAVRMCVAPSMIRTRLL